MNAITDTDSVLALEFDDKYTSGEILNGAVSIQIANELQEYFSGKRKLFTLNLKPQGTVFQLQVWEKLLSIPFGKTISYNEQAVQLGSAKKIRASASANGKNPIAIIVPCHRVIGTSGALTGYAGGLWRKEKLLQLESGSQQIELFSQ
ncbi:MAG: methylated-DNA--[protein]-cysteine S-methyltransferase [Bacteroidia bacterium]|nr:methylated-DNA--[protein]-cysteine S-methyltransferase [Bacteroidia bacterium]MBP7715009.1 methylated-DNA--[protein]-cysteine S-methyltransferase [Bacteroidia bacterium]MBP8668054.1 methylated-DNA--[protein]-cysteine S-methyltransferase [Bacteroidia bacterium]